MDDLLQRKHLAPRIDSLIFNGQPAYKLSKATLNIFTRVTTRVHSNKQSLHGSNSVSFVAVCPGDVTTDMMDIGCVNALHAKEAAARICPLLDVSSLCKHNGMFVRYGEQLEW